MAKSFKEIGKKAEALIEQGNEAERKVQACQGRVASANSRVAMARAQLAAARETDEEGNPKGDVQQAQAQLSMAQNQLAASQRALSTAKGDVARVNQEKQSHIQTIEQHNKAERSNLQKLQRIKGSVFSQDSAALTKGMAERLNAAEDTRVALLRSMGIEAAAEYVPVDGDGTGATPWAVGGFSALDLSGEIQNYQGGSSSVAGGNQTTGDPRFGDDGSSGAVSSGATPIQTVKDNDGMARDGTNGIAPQNGLSQPNGQADYLNYLAGNLQNADLTIAEQKAILNAMRNILLCQSQNSVYEEEPPKVLRKTPQQIWDEGSRYIDNILEVYRDELRDKGVVDGPILEAAIAEYRQQYMQLLSSDHANRTFHLYDHDVPDFKELAEQLKAKDIQFAGSTVQTEHPISTLNEKFLGDVPSHRKEVAQMAFKKAPKEIVSELNNYSGNLQPIVDSGYEYNKMGQRVKCGAYYSPNMQQVFMDESADDAQYQETLPHELSHFLDHQRGWDSNKPEFVSAVESVLTSMDRSTPEGRQRFNEMLDDAINTGAADDRAVSDLIFAVFGEEGNDKEIWDRFDLEGVAKWTHSDNYWMGIDENGVRSQDGGASMRRAEIYAEIGAIRCLGNRISNNFLERYFADIYSQYNKFYNINE